MTTQSLVGLFALFVLWINTLLIVSAALQSFCAIGARRQRMRPLAARSAGVGLVAGTVARGEPLARRMIDQVGRQAAGSAGQQTILFHDRGYRSEVIGGALRVGDAELALAAPGAEAQVEVWVDDATLAAAATGEDAQFTAAYAEARKARGYARVVIAELRPGQRVWALGEVKAGRLAPDATGELVLSSFDPRAWCVHKQLLLALFIVGVLVTAGACTTLALWPPRFGTVSTLGGALGLAYFLGVQPIAVQLRDLGRPPAVAILRGSWRGR